MGVDKVTLLRKLLPVLYGESLELHRDDRLNGKSRA